jgi:phosphoribosylaminoimidazolecarboxamide formyltransferase / IMP cyclohydrolase
MTSPIRRALISVFDKTGLIEFAQALEKLSIEIISTGGTAKTLQAAGIRVVDVESITGFPEIMDGRVKTLHPKIHGGLLSVRGLVDHETARKTHGIENIDLLVSNLYPFEDAVAKKSGWDSTIENIDVGGPAMIRGAAKNHESVTVVVSPEDYELVLAEIKTKDGNTSHTTRRTLAAKAFARTAAYDAAISQWFASELKTPTPDYFATGGKRIQTLRYGENPHQAAALYASPDQRKGVASATQIQGKELSYNNINDTDAAMGCLAEFGDSSQAACVIVKHANPCGVAVGNSPVEAYRKALVCDPVSAFGGILAFNRSLDAETALEISKLFTEVILAPDADEGARKIIAKKKNLRLLLLNEMPNAKAPSINVKSVIGGLLVQTGDNYAVDKMELKVVTKRAPTPAELSDLKFAFKVAKHVKSNAIIYARDGATVGIGAGQMSRIDSARIAVRKSEDAATSAGLALPLVHGSVVASDAFFPFADGLLQAAEACATAVIQPGGSIKDDEVIKAADDAGLAMIFTGIRHFRH